MLTLMPSLVLFLMCVSSRVVSEILAMSELSSRELKGLMAKTLTVN